MTDWLAGYLFPDTWKDLRRDVSSRVVAETLAFELRRELHEEHLLANRPITVIARSLARDDVILALDATTAAIVHLTYTRTPPERPPWPGTELVDSSADMDLLLSMRE
jgi:hypothetical protein